jgi:hypothetical protein
MLINGLKKVAGVASRLMGGMDLAKKSEDGIQVTESVSIRKDRVFRRTQTSEETLDTLSIFSKTTARLPTNKKTKSKFHQALAPAPASITLASRQRSREKGVVSQTSYLPRKHARSTSPELDHAVERKKTRRTGHMAGFIPSDWSKVPERMIRQGRQS